MKKQGILPLTFENPEDYNLITERSRISTIDLISNLSTLSSSSSSPSNSLKIRVQPENGPSFDIKVKHTLSTDQADWFKAGSALNLIRQSVTNSN